MGKQPDFYYLFVADAVCVSAFLSNLNYLDVMQLEGQLP